MEKIRSMFLKFFYLVKMKVFVFTSGNVGNFKFMLYLYGLIPACVVVFYLHRKIELYRNFLTLLVAFFLMIYFSWHLYVIWKTLKVQPKYKKPKKIKKKDLYAGKTKEELEELKKQSKKEFLDKMLLRKSWNDTPDYVIISCCDVLVVWMELSYILKILNLFI